MGEIIKEVTPEVWNRVKINCKAIFRVYIKILGSIFSILGVISVFFDIQEILVAFGLKIISILSILLFAFLIALTYTVLTKKVTIRSVIVKEFDVTFGDLFRDTAPIKVIPFNCCFDTVVNDTLIAEKTLHGQFINKYFKNNIDALDMLIEEALHKKKYTSEQVNFEIKPEGKKTRYPFGSIAEIKHGDTIFYLLALTEFDENLNAHCNCNQYACAINSLLAYYDKHSQGWDISIPLIGSGDMSRLNKGKQYVLETLVSLIKMNDDKLRGKLKIIVFKGDRDVISIRNLV